MQCQYLGNGFFFKTCIYDFNSLILLLCKITKNVLKLDRRRAGESSDCGSLITDGGRNQVNLWEGQLQVCLLAINTELVDRMWSWWQLCASESAKPSLSFLKPSVKWALNHFYPEQSHYWWQPCESHERGEPYRLSANAANELSHYYGFSSINAENPKSFKDTHAWKLNALGMPWWTERTRGHLPHPVW